MSFHLAPSFDQKVMTKNHSLDQTKLVVNYHKQAINNSKQPRFDQKSRKSADIFGPFP